MAKLEIHFFGQSQFFYDGHLIAGLQTKRMRSLLGYLLLHAGQRISATQLAFLYWPDTSEKQARTNLRRAFYNLRQVFPESDEFIERSDHTVCWRADADYVLDVDQFTAGLELARQQRQSENTALTGSALEEAVARYRGDLLPDCYDDWIAPHRERLRQDYLAAVEKLTELQEMEGNHGAAIRYGEMLVREDPLRERSYHTLMQLHLLNGDRPAALRVYHTCASELARELGVEPDAELTDLYQRILARESVAPQTPPAPSHRAEGEQLVGRTHERRRLFAAWRKAAAGRPGCVLIRGEAGIGKTRLAQELYRWAEKLEITAVRTRAYEAASTLAYAPILEWLRTPILTARLDKIDTARLQEVARLAPELLTTYPELAPPQSLVEDWQRTRLYEALAHIFCLERQPLLLWIDDLQWCDSESLAWFQYLLQYDRQAPLLLLGTVRDEQLALDHPITRLEHNLRRDEQLTEIRLDRLSGDETVELGRVVTFGRLTEAALAHQSRLADGNPLFMLEMVRAGLEALPAAGETRTFADEASTALELPTKVQSVIQARLAQLSASARALVGMAATIGRGFTVELLLEAGDMEEDDVIQHLDELWRRRIIAESSAGATDAYDFSHDRIRDVAYAELSTIRRRYYHRIVAEALETLHAARLDEWSADIAQHFEQAGKHASASGYYSRAAARAAANFAHRDAIRYVTRALDLVDEADLAMRFDLHAQRERTYHLLASRSEQVRELDAMHALTERLADPAKRSTVLLRRAALAEVQGAYQEAIAWVEQVRRHDGRQAAGRHGVEAAIRLGSLHWNLGDYPAAAAHYEEGLALARAQGEQRLETAILLHLGALNAYYGPYEEAQRISREALEAARAIGDEEGQIWAHNQLAFVIVAQGEAEYGEAEASFLAGLELARRTGNRTYIAKLSSNLATLYDRLGEREQALACLDESLVIARETGAARHEAFALNHRGNVLFNQGLYASARQAYTTALDRFCAIGYRQGEGKTQRDLALLALVCGEPAQALEFAAEGRAIADELGILRDQAAAYTRSGYILESRGERSQAREVYEHALAIYQTTGQHRHALKPQAGLARLAAAAGDADDALSAVGSILDQISGRALDATCEAHWVLFTCRRILTHSQAPEATELLARLSHGQAHAPHGKLAKPEEASDIATHEQAFCNAFETPHPVI